MEARIMAAIPRAIMKMLFLDFVFIGVISPF
jgi:hypothetical protein